ncbi:MAG TPA: TadE family type IV pilus minor pilin [Marmoricola sp.]|nr:TadE family type IV pilus minor pilin [Marmoricola sp.]
MRRRSESGAVTAEAAFGLCLLALVAIGLAWMICLGVVAIQAQDAAREAARALARGDSTLQAVDLAAQAAPKGSSVSTEAEGRLVRVTVRSPVRGPGGIFGFIGPLVISGQAVGLVDVVP